MPKGFVWIGLILMNSCFVCRFGFNLDQSRSRSYLGGSPSQSDES